MIDTAEMLKVFNAQRGDAIVVPGRGGRYWVNITDQPDLDLPMGDPAMGGHASFAFGLALAQPKRKVVLFDSEGDLQMGLGILLTIAELKPANFYHFLLDNECYGTTGGQPVPNAKNVDYMMMAKAAGYPRAYSFTEIDKLTAALPEILGQPGPVFVAMKVHPDVENKPIDQRVRWRKRGWIQVIADLQRKIGIAA